MIKTRFDEEWEMCKIKYILILEKANFFWIHVYAIKKLEIILFLHDFIKQKRF